MNDDQRVSDDELSAIARGEPSTTSTVGIATMMAVELIQTRRRNRADSRRSEQVKKLRWAVENTLAKVEALAKAELELVAAQDRADAAEDAAAGAERRTRELGADLRKLRASLARATECLDLEAHEEIVEIAVKDLELLITRIEAL